MVRTRPVIAQTVTNSSAGYLDMASCDKPVALQIRNKIEEIFRYVAISAKILKIGKMLALGFKNLHLHNVSGIAKQHLRIYRQYF